MNQTMKNKLMLCHVVEACLEPLDENDLNILFPGSNTIIIHYKPLIPSERPINSPTLTVNINFVHNDGRDGILHISSGTYSGESYKFSGFSEFSEKLEKAIESYWSTRMREYYFLDHLKWVVDKWTQFENSKLEEAHD